ncbi:MAG: adenylate kinase [bacterium]
MITVILGINGVGKSTVVKKVIKQVNFERVHWGRIMEKLAAPRGLIKHIDELRKVDIRMQRFIQEETVDVIKKQIDAEPNKNYIIETHAALKTPQGYLPGFNLHILEKIKPDMFIIVEAAAESIWKRRAEDPTRDRNDDSTLFDVEMNLEVTRNFASSYAIAIGATLAIVENKQGELDKAVNKIVSYLKMFDENANKIDITASN